MSDFIDIAKKLVSALQKEEFLGKLAQLPLSSYYQTAREVRLSLATQDVDSDMELAHSLFPDLTERWKSISGSSYASENSSSTINTEGHPYEEPDIDKRLEHYIDAINKDIQLDDVADVEGRLWEPWEDYPPPHFYDKYSRDWFCKSNVEYLLKCNESISRRLAQAKIKRSELARIVAPYLQLSFDEVHSTISECANQGVHSVAKAITNLIRTTLSDQNNFIANHIAEIPKIFSLSKKIHIDLVFRETDGCEFSANDGYDEEGNTRGSYILSLQSGEFAQAFANSMRGVGLGIQGGPQLQLSNDLMQALAEQSISCSPESADEQLRESYDAIRTPLVVAASLYADYGWNDDDYRKTIPSFVLNSGDKTPDRTGRPTIPFSFRPPSPSLALSGRWDTCPWRFMCSCRDLYLSEGNRSESLDTKFNVALRLWSEAISAARPIPSTALLAASIEAMLGKKEQDLTEKLSTRVATLLEPDRANRVKVKKFFKKLYAERCDLLHGNSVSIGDDLVRKYESISAAVIAAAFEYRGFLIRGGWPEGNRMDLLQVLDDAHTSGDPVMGVCLSPAAYWWADESMHPPQSNQ